MLRCIAPSWRPVEGVTLEIVLIDRPLEPVTEGSRIAIGAFPSTFGASGPYPEMVGALAQRT